MSKNPSQRPTNVRRRRIQNGSRRDLSEPRTKGRLTAAQMNELTEVAAQSFQSPNPNMRFGALIDTVIELAVKAEMRGDTSAHSIQRAITLTQILIEASEGNYSNKLWPPRSKKRGRKSTPFDMSRAIGAILGLIGIRVLHDACDSWQACSRVAYDLDASLAEDGITLADWVSPYKNDKGHRIQSQPHSHDDGWEPHELTGRLEGWLDKDPPGFAHADAWGHSARALLDEFRNSLEQIPDETLRRAWTERLYQSALERTADFVRWSHGPKLKTEN